MLGAVALISLHDSISKNTIVESVHYVNTNLFSFENIKLNLFFKGVTSLKKAFATTRLSSSCQSFIVMSAG